MKKRLASLIIPCFLTAGAAYAQSFQFEYHEIGKHGKNSIGQTSLVDVDNDGDLDWVYGIHGTMFWFEFQGPDKWIHHKIGEGAKTDVGGCPIDLNKDGWIDFVAGTGWYENTGNPKSETFIVHSEIGTISCHDNIAVDIDRDSILDIVANSNDEDHPFLVWYKIADDPEKKWKATQIGKGIHGGISPFGYGDLDKDGDMDIVRGDAWFENVDGKGNKWREHNVLVPLGGNRPERYGLALKSWVYDMDKDGDLDIVEAEADTPDGRIYWFENRKKARKWVYHLISEEHTSQDFHSLALADFDNDGDVDIFSGGGPLSQETHKMFIWENKSGDASVWVEHLILERKRCHEAVAADVDGDGDIDICTKPWSGDLHLFLENRLK
ncbi:MAG: FG-GAP repeat domain-containing protein [Mangrovibacterium sp.]